MGMLEVLFITTESITYIAIQIWIGKILSLAGIWTHNLHGTSLTRNQLERIWNPRVLNKIQFGLIRINKKLSKTDCSNKKMFLKIRQVANNIRLNGDFFNFSRANSF